MIADHYYGTVATGYERKRKDKPVWVREQRSVADWVTEGPVLDCPVGTGRYLGIYHAAGLDAIGIDISPDMLAIAQIAHPHAMLIEGTVFDLPWHDNQFAVAVCTRLLNWLYPRDMQRAVKELRRVSRSLVIGVRTGAEGVNDHRAGGIWTHDPNALSRALGRDPEKALELECYPDGSRYDMLFVPC